MMVCNVCGANSWADMGVRHGVRCASCNSLERTRIMKLFLDYLQLPKPGMRVLHIAPEPGLARYLMSIPNIDYHPVDYEPELYQFCQARKIDLRTDAAELESDYYDLIIHSHVMEHVKCNISVILFHLHRALKADGFHLFSVPVVNTYTEEDLGELAADEATKRFGQADHVRNFGLKDFDMNLGMLYRANKYGFSPQPEQFSLYNTFTAEQLDKFNIPEADRTGLTPSSVFVTQKYDLVLLQAPTPAEQPIAVETAVNVAPATVQYSEDEPLISVLIPTYNHGEFLGQAIESALAQQFHSFEVIVSDNCSTDNTQAVVARYQNDPRLRYSRNDSNLGMVGNMQKLLELAQGEYCAVLCADDFYLPGHLKKLASTLIQQPKVDVIYANVYYANETGDLVEENKHFGLKDYSYVGLRNEFASILAYGLHIKAQSMLIRTELYQQCMNDVSPAMQSEFTAGDTDMFLKLAAEGACFAYQHTDISAVHRRHGQQSTGHATYHQGQHLIDNLKLWEKYITDQNAHLLAGYEADFLNFVQFNLALLAQHPQQEQELLPVLSERITVMLQKVQRYMDLNQQRMLPPQPLVSVIMPTKDRPLFLADALRSLTQQRYTNWQAIVVNDGGCDVEGIVRSFDPQGDKIHYIALPDSRGHAGARNVALEFAQGEIITYLDDDNIYRDQHLQTVVDYLVENQQWVVYTQGVWVDEVVRDGRRQIMGSELRHQHESYTDADLLVVNHIDLNVLAHRRNCFMRCPRFDEQLSALVDWDLVLGLQHAFTINHVNAQTVEIRARQNQADNVSRQQRKNFYDLFNKIYAKHPVADLDLVQRREQYLLVMAKESGNNGVATTTDTTQSSDEVVAAGNLLEKAVKTAATIQEPLPLVLNKLLEHPDLGYISEQDKESLLLQAAEFLIKKLLKDTDYQHGRQLKSKLRQQLEQTYHIINEIFAAEKQSPALIEMKTQLRHLVEYDEYQHWIVRHERREVDAEVCAERMLLHWSHQPLLHCYMFVLPDEQPFLADTIDSLAAQLTNNWQLTVIGFTPAPDPVFAEADFLHWRMLQQDEDPYQVLNEEMTRTPTQWVTLIEPGVQYSADSLIRVADTINLKPNCSFIYTDDDWVDEIGMRHSPRFKPDFNLDLLRSSPYIGHGWMPASALLQIGGVQALPGAENYDLALRWFDSFGEQDFYHITDVLTHRSGQVNRPFNTEHAQLALQQHFERNQLAVEITEGYAENSFRVSYLHQTQPKVSIIIPTKDKLEFLQPCLESVLAKTSYPNYEVLVVDNQSKEPDTFAYYQKLGERDSDKVKVLYYDKPFNFSDMNNWAAQQATGEFLLLLNNDTEIIQADWLSRMMMHGQREDVGIVGARLIYPGSGLTQHTGVVLGMSFIADHPYVKHLTLNDSSHMDRAMLDQNYSAVTAAVMLVKKSIYDQVDGMNSTDLAVLFNDVDLCLKVGELGYRIVYTPYAIAVHHGSTSVAENSKLKFYYDWQGRADKMQRIMHEQTYMLKNWLPLLANDPAYNPHLSLAKQGFNIEIDAPLNWQREHHLRHRCYGVPLSGASGDYRLRQPFSALAKAGITMCEYGVKMLTVTELERMQPDTVVVQNAISDQDLETLQMYREFSPQTRIIFLLDDLVDAMPEKSSLYKRFTGMYRDARVRLRKALSFCDRLIVSTQPLADACRDMIDDIVVIPNRLQQDIWTTLSPRQQDNDKPRVGWVGAQQHLGDLEIIAEVVRETSTYIDWVFMGMCPDDIQPYVKEFYDFVGFEEYPEQVASLNLDLAIAPLEKNAFNEAKSNLRILEYGVLGWPVICSDIYPYQQNNPPVVRVENEKQAWLDAINLAVADKAQLRESGEQLRQWVLENYMLEAHLNEWAEGLNVKDLPPKKGG